MVSSITSHDLLSPLEIVDSLESDIQMSQSPVFPIFDGNKSDRETRHEPHQLFKTDGWGMVFSDGRNSSLYGPLRNFTTNDGVLPVVNQDL